ncbi:MAG: M48 family metalloprotease [Hyphomonadaceae bacterium]|nr:M48 family metalloprotease [Hyphomonadaceae bacterium]
MVKKTVFLIAMSLILFGCASVETKLPQLDLRSLVQESVDQERQAFSRYLDMRERLDRVSAQVLAENADLCEKTATDIGIVIHSTKSYPKNLRAAAQMHLGALDEPSVLMVRAESAAEKAGFVAGDVITDKNGDAVSFFDKEIQEEFDKTGLIGRRRAGDAQPSMLKPQGSVICGFPVQLKFSTAINAYANGKSITVTTGMMEFAARDEELALVVGHELAHNTMRHVPKSIRNLLLSGFAVRTTRPFESEADYVGMYYLARAGFELDGVEDFWRRLGVVSPKSIVRAKTHPVTPERLLSIRATAQEIEAKQKSGEPLTPNYLKDANRQDES